MDAEMPEAMLRSSKAFIGVVDILPFLTDQVGRQRQNVSAVYIGAMGQYEKCLSYIKLTSF
ncbi:MAG: hypothetical protein IIC84_06230 [Chloroflexi bacterium]|nr:hypothetical protein [Chloroflexota bacterium]